jgi:hypothetical protein
MSIRRREMLLGSVTIVFLFFTVQLGSCNSLPTSSPGDLSHTPDHSATRQPTHTATHTSTSPPTYTPRPTFTPQPAYIPQTIYYVDGELGSDWNPGSEDQPWRTIQKAVERLTAGELVYIRGGEYVTVRGGWYFRNSGTQSKPITLSNYPGEQVHIKIMREPKGYTAFVCWYSPGDGSTRTPKVDHIRIIGTDVGGSKGIVIQGYAGVNIKAMGVESSGCDYWEVAGLEFIDLAYGIFTKKRNYKTIFDYSPDHWYVHDNKVYSFYRESGMQFNGNFNLIEDNEIYKVTDNVSTPYGCQMLNILGNNNVIRGNTLSRKGSQAQCLGILLEWDLADVNLIEENTISDVGWDGDGVMSIAGGDNNTIRNNTVYASTSDWYYIYPDNDGFTGWPCNEESVADAIIPANDPAAADYIYYYPHDCRSVGNQIYDNINIQE